MDGEIKSNGFPRWLETIVLGRHPKWTLVRIAVVVLTTFFLYKFVFIPIRVQGISMSPNYKDGSINVINRLSFLHRKPQRGEVVGVRMAGEHIMLMKRIVGLPGESISFRFGKLYINDQEVDEPYVKYPCNWNMDAEHLGPNFYYVVGDNRSMRISDHTQGRADFDQIAGKVMLGGKS